jgi:hypothetical protein
MRAQRLLARVAAATYTYAYVPSQRLLTRAAIAQGHNSHSSCYLPFAPLEDWISLVKYIGLFGCSVLCRGETDADTEHRSGQKQKPKPNRKTEKTDISVLARFSLFFGFSKKCPPLPMPAQEPSRQKFRVILSSVIGE